MDLRVRSPEGLKVTLSPCTCRRVEGHRLALGLAVSIECHARARVIASSPDYAPRGGKCRRRCWLHRKQAIRVVPIL